MRLVISSLALGLLALGVLSACNSAEWKDLKASSTSAPAQPPAAPHADGVRRVTVSELKDLVAKNEAFVVDVRNQAAFDAGHIRGAKLIPEAEVGSRSAELPKNKVIVTYCS